MKKILFTLFISCFLVITVFAENSANVANRNTALRCLKLAENCLVGGDWENALNQAELGISYDDGISDLIYIKAAAKKNLGYKNADILPVLFEAFEKNDWVGYTKSGARILLADILCDTGDYDKSLDILNEEPLIFSADAEFIRIKNYYRLGTLDSIENARVKVNSARRIYPSDVRFPSIFFTFEALIKNESVLRGINYEIPENVQIIADSYIAKFPDYSDKNEDLEIYASFLARNDIRQRLIKSISAKTKSKNPMLVIAQKEIGMISDSEAFELFFEYTGKSIHLNILEYFVSLISDDDVKQKIIEKMTNYDGDILIDDNLDLQFEINVEYSLGRPQSITFDKNNDGCNEIFCICDYGAPVLVNFPNDKTEIFYDVYPKVQKVHFVNNDYTFNFLNDDFIFFPFDLIVDNQLKKLGLDFYIPAIKEELSVPTASELAANTSSVELPIDERVDSRVVYTIFQGNLVFAKFYEGDKNYAICDFSTGLPFIRYADYDNDDYFETTEIFDEAPVNYVPSDSETAYIEKIFSQIVDGKNVYLKKVQIDRNSNTFAEFSEEYMPGGGSIITWDNDDNGLPDCQFIKYPANENQSVIEESIFYDSNGLEIISLYTADGIPMKMNYGNEEVIIYSGQLDNIYWIDEKSTIEAEEKILEYSDDGFAQGVIDLIEYKNERFSIIRIGSDIYCKKIPYDAE